MKKTINVAIGGCSFTIDEDAYNALNQYLERFESALDDSNDTANVMDELEVRISDLLKGKLGGRQVVDLAMAQDVITHLGYPEGYKEPSADPEADSQDNCEDNERPVKKLFRDPDGKKVAGVCSGLSLFFGIDVVLIRIIFLVGLFCVTGSFWIYLVIWIAAPEARTATEKCEMRGIPANAENIRRFTGSK